MICPHYGYIKRGTEVMTEYSSTIMRKRGYSVDVLSMGINVNGLRIDKGLGKLSYKVTELSFLTGFCRKYLGFSPSIETISFALSLETFLKKNQYDFLWTNGDCWDNIVCKKTGIPYLSFFGGGISKMMQKESELLPDVFVVLTPQMLAWIKSKVPDCHSVYIPNGVDLELFKPKKLNIFSNYEPPIVLSTSALVETKRIDLIIDAMELLGKGTLILTSDGPMRNTLIQKGTKQLKDRFVYKGVVPYDTLPDLYANADVFVLASRNEPFGNVILESMACNTPVVAQRDETREWIIGDGGVLVNDCSDIPSLTSDIELAYKHDWKDKPRKQAEKFDWNKIVDMYIMEIKKVIEK